MESHEPVVSAVWLHANLKNPDIKVCSYYHLLYLMLRTVISGHGVLDASWYMPQEQRNAFQEYQKKREKKTREKKKREKKKEKPVPHALLFLDSPV
ncbi:hypothetical protein BHE74_00009150 [Ensete ventricosum]|nr:hypothetical protein GW17_00039649 [Ensete ventricosum]RWW82390.1 hypothetical protein BHE74_00009150 [Ensete ventricosum]RZR95544.1 hypothetical protein BHM03_00024399 [Ensete ventricosum]